MRNWLCLSAAAMLLGMGTSASADVMGSAPAYGGSSQNAIVCYYSNVGNTSVTFTSSSILVEPGNFVAEVSEFCAGSLPPNGRCRTVSVSPILNGAHWCRAVVSAKGALRGRMEIRSSTNAVLSSQNIQ
jgi:hypothetical protein